MKTLCLFTLFALLSSCAAAFASSNSAAKNPTANYDVTWSTLGTNENDSMPIGNGDIAANVWTEQNGDIVLLVAKSDSWTELGKIVKLGRVRITLSPNPFADSSNFTQTLKLEDGVIEIRNGANAVLIWIDANNPAIHVQAHLAQPGTLKAVSELWRTTAHSFNTPSPDRGGLFEFGNHSLPIGFEADTVLPAKSDRISWCHYNQESIYPTVLQQEHLESLLTKYPDPYLHRCFGAALVGPNMISDGDATLKSASAAQDLRVDIYALTAQQCASPQAWQSQVDTLVDAGEKLDITKAFKAHQQWWNQFWNRSWMSVTGTPDAEKVAQGYAMQRWMMACSSRGAQPAKFNGGLFTVGHDISEERDSTPDDHNPDYRQWGSSYWNQNNRLLYWPLMASGDGDLLKPWFDMYVNALPMATDRTQAYYHHAGAAFVETEYFWGLPNLNDFGWDNSSNQLQSGWMRYHIQGALEVVAQMLDQYDYSQDKEFARQSLIPLADAILTYYDQHWQRGADGKIYMSPTQSLETYQIDAVNPTPDVAGLTSVIPRMLALPAGLISDDQRKRWTKTFQDLPAIPMGTTAKGKLPPHGQGDADGVPTILPAEKYGKTSNAENPELYVAFPYRLYGVGKPGLDLARATYAARLFHFDTCWGQDGTEAATLGLTNDAQKAAIAELTCYGGQRFSWFWKTNSDWIPDLDNGGSGMITLQAMLMQCDGRRIQLLPAWPAEWTADFKLHAPYQTTVEGHVENGKVTQLKVTPSSRAKDVIILPVG